MRIVRSVAGMQRLSRDWQRKGTRVALVPTMGYLHAGHLSLVQRARRLVGRGKVVVSIYVNPTQFGPKEDFSRYPRDFARDRRLCQKEGVDVIFAPDNEQMYPRAGKSGFSTYVTEEKVSQRMEGASRPGHFRGVTTVVAKLFNIVQPQFALFGAKDFQQAAVVKRMARDLNFPLRVEVAPTLRAPDGLALSSRNKYLEGSLREQATVLWRATQKVRVIVRAAHKPVIASRLKADLRKLIQNEPAAKLDYVEFFNPHTFEPVARVERGVHMALAIFIGSTRLIDNGRI
jgi:pantoate--beta-alanine ligase